MTDNGKIIDYRSKIEDLFFACGREYAERWQALDVETYSDKAYSICRIKFRMLMLEFVFWKKNSYIIMPCTLFCKVYLSKTEERFFQIPELLAFLKIPDYRICCFSCIESKERMKDCFTALAELVEDHREQFEKLVYDGLREKCNAWQDKEIGRRGEKLFSGISEDFIPVADMGADVNPAKPYISGKGFVSRGLLAMLLVSGIFAVVYGLFSFIVQGYLSRNTAVYCSAPWYFSIIMAILPGVFGGAVFYRKMIPLFYRKNQEKARAFDKMFRTGFSEYLGYLSFLAAVLLSFCFLVIVDVDSVRFYDTYFDYTDPESVSLLRSRIQVPYQEIAGLYHINSRHNQDGDTIHRGSYVMVFSDGTVFDLDGYTSEAYTAEHILPILGENGLEPEELDSDAQLPKKGS